MDRNVAGGSIGRSGDKSDFGRAHKRRVSARNVRFWPIADIALTSPRLTELCYFRRKFVTFIGDGAVSLQQPLNHHLAQLNIGRIRYEIDDPRMADFTNNLAMVNGLAECTPGFVWRYIDESGNSTSTRPYSDPRIAINLSVWENVEALERFVYQTIHKRFYGRRAEWFEHFDGPYFVMWWVTAGHRPSVDEAVAHLQHLKKHGPSDHAFDWQAVSAQLWKTARCAPAGQVA